MNLRQELEKRISAALAAAGAPDASAMVAPTDPKFGDYKASGVMGAAKRLKLNPRELAQKVSAQLQKDASYDLSGLAEKIEIAGPGFINITLRKEWLQDRLIQLRANEKLGVSDALAAGSRLNVVVDYSAPNLAKEMHVGHLRSTIIGDALARVLEFQGHNVIRQNHVGDWGTQFGMLAVFYFRLLGVNAQKLGGNLKDKNAELTDLEEFYRKAKAEYDANPEFAQRSREMVVKLQGGDSTARQYWEWFRTASLNHCKEVYALLGVKLTDKDIRGESAYNDDLPNVIADLQKAGLLTETTIAQMRFVPGAIEVNRTVVIQKSDQGLVSVLTTVGVSQSSLVFAGIQDVQLATCVFLPQFKGKDGMPLPLIVRKSDEGYLYATTDLAAIRYRVGTLHADRILYVVDARQSLRFQMVLATARAAGFAPENVSLEHVAFGTMMGADGKPFKTRTGGTVKLMDLLDEAVKRAYDLVTQKNTDEVAKGRSSAEGGLSEEQKKSISEAVGIGAVKYADLAQNRNSDYVFSWDKMLAMDGNTAPYMQYAYARIKSIRRKFEQMFPAEKPASRDRKEAVFAVQEPAERALAVKLLQFPETIATVAADCLPSVLCAYLYDLAGAFTTFYENCPVLKSEPAVRESRLALCELTAQTIKKGLELLGIATIEQM